MSIKRTMLLAGMALALVAFMAPSFALDETGEPLAALLRPGNAAEHTVADHFEVL